MNNFVVIGDFVFAKAMRADQWTDAIGRSLYLAATMNLKPGVILVTQPGDKRVQQAKMACDRGGIKLWTATVD